MIRPKSIAKFLFPISSGVLGLSPAGVLVPNVRRQEVITGVYLDHTPQGGAAAGNPTDGAMTPAGGKTTCFLDRFIGHIEITKIFNTGKYV
jgi:hypothetical protein